MFRIDRAATAGTDRYHDHKPGAFAMGLCRWHCDGKPERIAGVWVCWRGTTYTWFKR